MEFITVMKITKNFWDRAGEEIEATCVCHGLLSQPHNGYTILVGNLKMIVFEQNLNMSFILSFIQIIYLVSSMSQAPC